MTDRVAMVFLKNSRYDGAYAVPGADTLGHACEVVELALYEKGWLDLGTPASAQLRVRWGHVFEMPGNMDVVPGEDDLEEAAWREALDYASKMNIQSGHVPFHLELALEHLRTARKERDG